MIATEPQTHNGIHEPLSRRLFREAVTEVATRATATLPQCNGRIESAVKIVLAGDVDLLPDGTAQVASQSNGAVTYFQVNGHCDCSDYPKAPHGGYCKHRLAHAIYKRASALAAERMAALDTPTPPAQASRVGENSAAAETPDTSARTTSIPAQFLVELHGKQFVQYAGLLAMAHDKGLVTLSAHFISVDASLALAEATAEFSDGRTFMECADATPENVNAKIRPHFPRMALTRAKARALRDALNISCVCLEELEG